jgi:threonine aldolase
MKSFASDNNAGVHPAIMQALIKSNNEHVISYGDDEYTASAIEKFKGIFGPDIEVFFVYNGTGANVLSISSASSSFNAVICPETAHINVDECGAPEKFVGCKLLTCKTIDGKLTPEIIGQHLHDIGVEHHSQPKVVSITQSTEVGTVYKIEELKAITSFAHKNGLIVHVDGARIANAAVSLNSSLSEISIGCNVDILSFGGTKNGLMFGEAVVVFNKSLAENIKFHRKQAMQLASKMRFISAQFNAYLENDLWHKNATHANAMAQLLANKIQEIDGIKITQAVEANGVFAIVPSHIIPLLQKDYFFYLWNEAKGEVRWMTSFDTTEEDVIKFVKRLKELS